MMLLLLLLLVLLGVQEDHPLTWRTDMLVVARAMARPDSGLEIRDRLWLKITIARAFIGQFYFSKRLHRSVDYQLYCNGQNIGRC